MSSYFSFEEQQRLRTQAYMQIGVAWLMGAISLWAYANMESQIRQFMAIYILFLIAAKAFGFFGWKDYAKSKGYHWSYGLLTFVPVLGEAFLIFMNDRWIDQKIPTIKAHNQAW